MAADALLCEPLGLADLRWILLFPVLVYVAAGARTGVGERRSRARAVINLCVCAFPVVNLWECFLDLGVQSLDARDPGTAAGTAVGLLACAVPDLNEAMCYVVALWILPALGIVAIFLLSCAREISGAVLAAVLQQMADTPAFDPNIFPNSRGGASLQAACRDAVAASAVGFLWMGAGLASYAARGLVLATGGGWASEELLFLMPPAMWLLVTLAMAALQVAVPGAFISWAVVRDRRLRHFQAKAVAVGSVARAVTQVTPCEPWLPWQLAGDAIVVAAMELCVLADIADPGRGLGRWLGRSLAQALLVGQLVVLTWPRWLLCEPLLRINAAFRVALLVAWQLESALADMTPRLLTAKHLRPLAWPVFALAFAAWSASELRASCLPWARRFHAEVLRHWSWRRPRRLGGSAFGDDATSALTTTSASSVGSAWPSMGSNGSADRGSLTSGGSIMRPLALVARDFAQVSLSLVLSDPVELKPVCKSLTADERRCLSVGSTLVTSRLIHYANSVAEHTSLSELLEEGDCGEGGRLKSVNELSQVVAQAMLGSTTSNVSVPSDCSLLGKETLDWVAPLPVLDESATRSTSSKVAAKIAEDPLSRRKWVLDHCVPACNGPQDSKDLGTEPEGAMHLVEARKPGANLAWHVGGSNDSPLQIPPTIFDQSLELESIATESQSGLGDKDDGGAHHTPVTGGEGATSTSSCSSNGRWNLLRFFKPGTVFDASVFDASDVRAEQNLLAPGRAAASAPSLATTDDNSSASISCAWATVIDAAAAAMPPEHTQEQEAAHLVDCPVGDAVPEAPGPHLAVSLPSAVADVEMTASPSTEAQPEIAATMTAADVESPKRPPSSQSQQSGPLEAMLGNGVKLPSFRSSRPSQELPTIESSRTMNINNPPPRDTDHGDMIASKDIVVTNAPFPSKSSSEQAKASLSTKGPPTTAGQSNRQSWRSDGDGAVVIPEAYRHLVDVSPPGSLLKLIVSSVARRKSAPLKKVPEPTPPPSVQMSDGEDSESTNQVVPLLRSNSDSQLSECSGAPMSEESHTNSMDTVDLWRNAIYSSLCSPLPSTHHALQQELEMLRAENKNRRMESDALHAGVSKPQEQTTAAAERGGGADGAMARLQAMLKQYQAGKQAPAPGCSPRGAPAEPSPQPVAADVFEAAPSSASAAPAEAALVAPPSSNDDDKWEAWKRRKARKEGTRQQGRVKYGTFLRGQVGACGYQA